MSSLEHIVSALRGRQVVVLSGAGLSTDSGIPDYRGPGTLARARRPLQYRQFMDDPVARKRYWARSAVGWPRFAAARPNAGHLALAALEKASLLGGVITQNVDGLHQKAGSTRVIELHGTLAEVRCLECNRLSGREGLQERLSRANPGWEHLDGASAPDGDAEVETARFAQYQLAACEHCDGTLKPNVVFFGESVPAEVVQGAWALYDEADALLVVGSSLTLFSGFRFVRRAAQDGKAIVIINSSETRGDPLATQCWAKPLGEALPMLADRLLATRR